MTVQISARRRATVGIVLLAGTLGVGGCAKLPELPRVKIPGVYRIDVQQGNILDEASLAQLELGMPKSKVRFLIGTPAITDTFHQDRWDYVYTFQPGSGDREQRNVSLFFEGDKLTRITGDVPAGPAAPTPDTPPERVVDVPPGSGATTIFGRLKRTFRGSKGAPERAGAASGAAAAPAEAPPPEDAKEEPAEARAESDAPRPRSLFDRLTERFGLPEQAVPDDSAPVAVPAGVDEGR